MDVLPMHVYAKTEAQPSGALVARVNGSRNNCKTGREEEGTKPGGLGGQGLGNHSRGKPTIEFHSVVPDALK